MAQAQKIVTSRKAAAELFGVGINTFDDWTKDWKSISGCPCATRKYDVKWIAEWILSRPRSPERIRKKAAELAGINYADFGGDVKDEEGKRIDGVELKTQLLQAQIRKEQANADSIERKNRLAELDIVHRDDVRRFMAEFLSHIRTQFDRIPHDIQSNYPDNIRQQVVQDVKERLDMTLVSIVDWGKRTEEITSEDE